MNIDFSKTPKQYEAWQYLTDSTTTQICYAGAVRTGKSRIAWYWITLMCLKYPGVRYLVGRAVLNNLKKTTLKVFWDIAAELKLEGQFKFNANENVIEFNNGSEIILKDLKLNPSDKDFISLAGLELTGAFLDETAEIPVDAYTTIISRLSYKLTEYNLIPKLFIASNPTKNWLYDVFYTPYKENTLEPHKKFIAALPGDNGWLSQDYLNTLTRKDLGDAKYETLVLGNWEYANSDSDLFDSDALLNCFYTTSPLHNNNRYLTIDPASKGKDTTVITVWLGYDCIKIIQLKKLEQAQIELKVRELMKTYNIRITHVITDAVGIGVGLKERLRGCVGFIANSRPLNNEGFQHQKAQLYYRFAQLINDGTIGIADGTYRQEIIQELEAHKLYNTDKDTRAEITPKPLVKQTIGRSPDFSDSLVLRAYFEYKKTSQPHFYC
jgi:phage terminase large subunit